MSVFIPTIWWEVVYGSDGYASVARFKTEDEATLFEQQLEDDNYGDTCVYSGATEVSLQDHFFYHKS